MEAVTTLIWAANKTDIPELVEIRQQFKKKYGKEFEEAALNNEALTVNERVTHKLSVLPPSGYLVYNYLVAIANEFNVDVDLVEEDYNVTASNAVMSAPSGFSVPMAPLSNISSPYQSTTPSTGGNHQREPIPTAVTTTSTSTSSGMENLSSNPYSLFNLPPTSSTTLPPPTSTSSSSSSSSQQHNHGVYVNDSGLIQFDPSTSNTSPNHHLPLPPPPPFSPSSDLSGHLPQSPSASVVHRHPSVPHYTPYHPQGREEEEVEEQHDHGGTGADDDADVSLEDLQRRFNNLRK